MKISLRLMTCEMGSAESTGCMQGVSLYVFMAKVFEQLQLAVSALGEDGRAERLHDLLDRDGRAGELVLG